MSATAAVCAGRRLYVIETEERHCLVYAATAALARDCAALMIIGRRGAPAAERWVQRDPSPSERALFDDWRRSAGIAGVERIMGFHIRKPRVEEAAAGLGMDPPPSTMATVPTDVAAR